MNNPYKIIYELREDIAELSERCREQETDIEELLKEREWISVKDRLPETYGRYLVHIENITGYEPRKNCIFIEYFLGDWIFTGWEIYRVTHWMPLPEPPESEGDTNA